MSLRTSWLGLPAWALFGATTLPWGHAAAAESPIKVAVAVSPEAISAGSDASVTVRIDPKPGIKLNKYPKIKLVVPAVPGLVGAAELSMGNAAPPEADNLDANYFHGDVDPLTLSLHLDAQATKGHHDISAKLSYAYCVAASGYCAPARVEVKIPVTVR